jgi:F-type H+-transporting ATPase subunit alpha
MDVEKQIAIIFAGTKGHLDEIPASQVKDFENGLSDYLDANCSNELESIRSERVMSEAVESKLDEAIRAFKGGFTA